MITLRVFALFCILAQPWQSLAAGNNLQAFLVTKNDQNETCDGQPRKWSTCYDFPPLRQTIDSCVQKTETCFSETDPDNASKNRFILPSLLLDENDLEHFSTRTKRQVPVVITPKRDLLILINAGDSVTEQRFAKLKNLAKALVTSLCKSQKLSPNHTRVSIVTYDRGVHMKKPLLDLKDPSLNSDSNALAQFIENNITFSSSTSGESCLNNALNYAKNTALKNSMGGRQGSKNAFQEIIVLSDGCGTCVFNLGSTLQNLDKAGITVYFMGIFLSRYCQRVLQQALSRTSCFRVTYVKGWTRHLSSFIASFEKPPVIRGIKLCVARADVHSNKCVRWF